MLRLADGRENLYQWDTDVKVNVNGDAEFVEFRLISSYDLLRVEVKDNTTTIPNILLQDGGAIIAYANCVCNGQNTKCKVTFLVTKRPKPIDYVYTETEVKRYDDLENRIENLEENGVSNEKIESVVREYLEENPVETGATQEQAAQIEQNKNDITELKNIFTELSNAKGITNTANGETIVLTDSDGKKLEGLRVFGKSEQNMTMSKNHCEIIIENQTVQNGITFIVNDDKSVTLNGTCTADSYVNIGTALLEGGIEYTISGCPATNGNVIAFYANCAPSSGNVWNRGYESTFTLAETVRCRCTMQIIKDAVLTNVTVYPMIRLASNTDSTYEPYGSGTITPNLNHPEEIVSVGDDGNIIVSVDKQNLQTSTPNGLPGIKVSDASIATYTDSEGNMWVADEVDFERGVYVQRIFKGKPPKAVVFESKDTDERCITYAKPFGVVFKNGTVPAMSTIAQWSAWGVGNEGTFALDGDGVYYKSSTKTLEEVNALFAEIGTNFEVSGILATPIETPLSESELEAYSKLHTNYPTTTIISEAHMEVKYGADTKSYIDNKFNELRTAVVALGGI